MCVCVCFTPYAHTTHTRNGTAPPGTPQMMLRGVLRQSLVEMMTLNMPRLSSLGLRVFINTRAQLSPVYYAAWRARVSRTHATFPVPAKHARAHEPAQMHTAKTVFGYFSLLFAMHSCALLAHSNAYTICTCICSETARRCNLVGPEQCASLDRFPL